MVINRDYIQVNKQAWNKRTALHLQSDFYDVKGFLEGESSLNDIELNLLGNIEGKSILHLQCHFGQDTISLARMGAHVTGVDLSDKAIEAAKELARKAKTNANFICCDIYDLPNYLQQKFDIVFTSYGTIGWLPDLDKWAKVASHFLKPNGKFVFVEFHPVVWMFDNSFKEIKYSYFNTEAIEEIETGTYAKKDAKVELETITWNHPISEVVNSLIKAGIKINSLEEYDYSPYNCFDKTIEIAPKKYHIKHFENKLPMVYSIVGKN